MPLIGTRRLVLTATTLNRLNEALVGNSIVRDCNLKAELRDGVLVVVGNVKSYYAKQVALQLAMQIAPDVYILTTEIVVE